jgi:hypothetical protein
MNSQTLEYGKRDENNKLNSINESEPDDLFLTSAGFESRALSGARSLSDEYSAEQGIIYVNKEYFEHHETEETVDNLERLEEILHDHCSSVDVVMGSWLEADEQLYSLKTGFEDLKKKQSLRVTADITTFNREALLVAFNILYSFTNDLTTRILYISPEEHGEWLSRGHQFVRNIIGFAGIQNSSDPTLLIILTGFEQDRTINTIEEIEPAKVLLGIGDPPTKQSFLKRNRQRQELALSRQDSAEFTFPANSISGAEEAVKQVISENISEYNIVISPMSTKLSTLGVWKAAREFPGVQVVYTIPGEYNLESYSSGSESIYVDWL